MRDVVGRVKTQSKQVFLNGSTLLALLSFTRVVSLFHVSAAIPKKVCSLSCLSVVNDLAPLSFLPSAGLA